MFDRFTQPSREVLVLAADEARMLGHDRIGTEHLLLGVVRLAHPSTAELGLKLAAARADVRAFLGAGGQRTIGELRFTLPAKRVLDRANDHAGPGGAQPAQILDALLGEAGSGAADLLSEDGDGPGDDGELLLEMAGRADSVAARALASLGVDRDRLRRAVAQVRRR